MKFDVKKIENFVCKQRGKSCLGKNCPKSLPKRHVNFPTDVKIKIFFIQYLKRKQIMLEGIIE
jgi:hypothetical protein